MTQGAPLSPQEQARRHQLGLLARALRANLSWQRELGADGFTTSQAEVLQAFQAKLVEAKQRHAAEQRAAQRAALGPSEARGPGAPPRSPEPSPRPQTPSRPAPSPDERRPPDAPHPADASPPTRKAAPATQGRNVTQLLKTQPPPLQLVPDPDKALDALYAPIPAGAEGLKVVRDLLGDCQRCKLSKTRHSLVFGDGDPNAPLVFIGEAPGFNEDRQGKPFVGDAGQLLNKMIRAMGYGREEVFIVNVVKCRPPGNRDPEPDELASCEPFLIRQLQALRPKVIVTLGKFATQALLRESTPITRLRGNWRRYQDVPVMPTLHPAYLLRTPEDKRLVWEDLQKVMRHLDGTQPAR
jgi:uracil-DNA glycosylase family 4